MVNSKLSSRCSFSKFSFVRINIINNTVFKIENWYLQLALNVSFVSKVLPFFFLSNFGLCTYCHLVVFAIIYYAQISLPVLSLKISTLWSNVVAFGCSVLVTGKKTQQLLLTQWVAASAAVTVHTTCFKVKVGLCNIASEGVAQICWTKCSRVLGTFAGELAKFLLWGADLHS